MGGLQGCEFFGNLERCHAKRADDDRVEPQRMEPRTPSSGEVVVSRASPRPDGRGVLRSTILLCSRQREQEAGAVVQLALGADRAAVRQHDVFGDGQAKAGASRFARAGFIHAIEALEQAG